MAHQQSDAFSLAVALMNVNAVQEFAENGQRCHKHRRRRSRYAPSEDLIAFWARPLSIGRAMAQQGQIEEGIGLIRRGLAAQLAAGAVLFRPIRLAPSEGIRDSRALGGRIGCCGRGDRNSGKNGRAPPQSRTASIEGRIGPPTFRCRNGAWCPNGSRGLLSPSHRHRPSTEAKSLELRAVMSLSRLSRSRARRTRHA